MPGEHTLEKLKSAELRDFLSGKGTDTRSVLVELAGPAAVEALLEAPSHAGVRQWRTRLLRALDARTR